MKDLEIESYVGLRERGTGKLAAVYPEPLKGARADIGEKVSYWYYQQSCEAEHELENLYVDILTEKEIKELP